MDRNRDQLWHEPISFGHHIYLGPVKLAVITSNHFNGLRRDGLAVSEPLPRSQWLIRFTSPEMSTDLVQAIAACIASIPDDKSPLG